MDQPDIVMSLLPSLSPLFSSNDLATSADVTLDWSPCLDLSPEDSSFVTDVPQALREHSHSPVSLSLDHAALASNSSLSLDQNLIEAANIDGQQHPIWPDPIAITATSSDFASTQSQHLQQHDIHMNGSLTSEQGPYEPVHQVPNHNKQSNCRSHSRVKAEQIALSSCDWQDQVVLEEQAHLERILAQNPSTSMISTPESCLDLNLMEIPEPCLPAPVLTATDFLSFSAASHNHLNLPSPVSNVSLQSSQHRSCPISNHRRPKSSPRVCTKEEPKQWTPDDVSSRITAFTSQEHLKSPLGKQRRRYNQPRSSKYCHLCARHQRAVEMLPCGNLQRGLCQKSVCRKCFSSYNLDWDKASTTFIRLAASEDKSSPNMDNVLDDEFSLQDEENCNVNKTSLWLCPHCENKCPKRAKCYAYDRQTVRRRAKTQELRQREVEEFSGRA